MGGAVKRSTESRKAAQVLRCLFDAKVMVRGLSAKQIDNALHLAISVLEARANDAETNGE